MKSMYILVVLAGFTTALQAQQFTLASNVDAVSFQNQVLNAQLSPNAYAEPGTRMMKVGKTLTIGGGILLIGGIALMSTADDLYYSSNYSPYGSVDQGDPQGALGLLMAVGGAGMVVPGIIFWSKGSKKYKAYKLQQYGSVGIGAKGISLRYRLS